MSTIKNSSDDNVWRLLDVTKHCSYCNTPFINNPEKDLEGKKVKKDPTLVATVCAHFFHKFCLTKYLLDNRSMLTYQCSSCPQDLGKRPKVKSLTLDLDTVAALKLEKKRREEKATLSQAIAEKTNQKPKSDKLLKAQYQALLANLSYANTLGRTGDEDMARARYASRREQLDKFLEENPQFKPRKMTPAEGIEFLINLFDDAGLEENQVTAPTGFVDVPVTDAYLE